MSSRYATEVEQRVALRVRPFVLAALTGLLAQNDKSDARCIEQAFKIGEAAYVEEGRRIASALAAKETSL